MNNESPAALLPEALHLMAEMEEIAREEFCTLPGMAAYKLAADRLRRLLVEYTAPVASESRGIVPDAFAEALKRYPQASDALTFLWYAALAAPTPPAVASGEPTAEHWKEAFRRWVKTDGSLQSVVVPDYALAWIEARASELARSAAAKGEG